MFFQHGSSALIMHRDPGNGDVGRTPDHLFLLLLAGRGLIGFCQFRKAPQRCTGRAYMTRRIAGIFAPLAWPQKK